MPRAVRLAVLPLVLAALAACVAGPAARAGGIDPLLRDQVRRHVRSLLDDLGITSGGVYTPPGGGGTTATVELTEDVAAEVARISLPAAGSYAAAHMEWVAFATDGTDFACSQGAAGFTVLNVSGTLTDPVTDGGVSEGASSHTNAVEVDQTGIFTVEADGTDLVIKATVGTTISSPTSVQVSFTIWELTGKTVTVP